MAVNDATLSLITEFEGIELEAYADPAHGWSVPTIGVGHTSVAGPPEVYKGQKITRAEAMEILQRDLSRVEAVVRRLVKVPIDQNQLGALVSFTFNLGEGNFAKSTLLRKLNAGDYGGASAEFKKWNRAGKPKKVLPGLTRRRAAEAALFASPVGAGTVVQPVPAPAAAPTPAETTSARTDDLAGQGEGFQISWPKIIAIVALLAAAALFLFR